MHERHQVQLDIKLDVRVILLLALGVGDRGMGHGQHQNVGGLPQFLRRPFQSLQNRLLIITMTG